MNNLKTGLYQLHYKCGRKSLVFSTIGALLALTGILQAAPPVPTGLSATAGNAQAILNWSASTGATSYNVYRGTASGAESATPIANGITLTSFADIGLSNGASYYYTVAAVNASGTSAHSSEVSAIPATRTIGVQFPQYYNNALDPLSGGGGNGYTAGVVRQRFWNCANDFTNSGPGNSGGTLTNIYLIPSGYAAAGLVDSTGAPSAVQFTLTNATNNDHGAASQGFPSPIWNTAGGLCDQFLAQGVDFSLSAATPVTLRLTGLNPADNYNLIAYVGAPWYDYVVSISVTLTGTTYYLNTDDQNSITGWTQSTYTTGTSGAPTADYVEFASVSGSALMSGTLTVQGNGSGLGGFQLTDLGGIPAAPTGLLAAPANAQVALIWSAVPGAASYNIYRGTTSGGESATPIATGLTLPTFTNTGLTNGVTYYFKVIAVNSFGSSTYSGEANATPATGGAAPSAPTGLAAAVGNTQLSLNWTPSSGAAWYNVYRGTSFGGESTIPVATGITSASYTDIGLANRTTYYYTVVAVNGSGSSATSNEASATPVIPIPAIPGGLSVLSGNAQATLSWSASEWTAGYNVYRGTISGGESPTPIDSGLTSTSYTDTGLTNGATYYYTVAATDSTGTSGYSNEVIASPSAPVPTGLMAMSGSSQIAVNWNPTSGALSYNVYKGTSSGAESPTPIFSGTTTAYIDLSVTNGATYYYTVAAVYTAGTSSPSTEAGATPASSGGTGDINLTGYTMTFDDEFNSSLSISTTSPKGSAKWFGVPPNGASGYFSESDWNDTAFSVSNGILSDQMVYSGGWQSGYMASVDTSTAGFTQTYGYFEIRCQMPNAGDGAWPAFWLDSISGITGGGGSEEVDIFEWYGICNTPGSYQDLVQETSHNWNPDGSQNTTTAPYQVSSSAPIPNGQYPWLGFHTYGCLIDPVHITWYIDGVQEHQCLTATAYMKTPFYVMINYAIGGGWPLSGSPFPSDGSSDFLVDWVRVYSLPAASGPPAAPTALTAIPSNAQVALNWTPGYPAGASYSIYRGTTSGGESPTPIATGLATPYYTDKGLINGTAYYYAVAAVATTGTALSGEASATPLANAATGTGIAVQFQGSGTALAYSSVAGVSTVAQTNWNVVPWSWCTDQGLVDSTGAGTTASITGVTNGVFTAGGSSASPAGNALLASGEVWNGSTAGNTLITVSGIPYASYDVYVYTSIDYTGRAETVQLTPSGGTAQYYSFTTEGGGSAWTAATSTWNGTGSEPSLPGANYVHFTGLTSGAFALTFWAPGNGAINGIQIVPLSNGVPAAPTGLAATAGNAQVGLTWTASTGVSTYDVYRGTASGVENASPIETGLTTPTYADTAVANGTTYYYTVSAVNSSGTSAYSTEASADPGHPSYAQWSGAWFPGGPSSAGDSATPQADGVANLLKYLCDINPTIPMSASAWAVLPTPGAITISGTSYITLTYRQSLAETGLTLAVQTSPDLTNWQTVTPASILTIGTDPATGDPLIQYQVPESPQPASKEYIRLNVTGP